MTIPHMYVCGPVDRVLHNSTILYMIDYYFISILIKLMMGKGVIINYYETGRESEDPVPVCMKI